MFLNRYVIKTTNQNQIVGNIKENVICCNSFLAPLLIPEDELNFVNQNGYKIEWINQLMKMERKENKHQTFG